MRNIVGQTPRGDDFFRREIIINTIYRRLDSGSNIYLSAPRRAGKTSIMRFMEDYPKDQYVFLYISVEDVASVEEYFQILSEELLNSKAVGHLLKASNSAKSVLDNFADRIKKLKIGGLELETQANEQLQYHKEFERLMRDLKIEDKHIVLLIDEFPIALERIAKETNNEEAIHFLHINRSIRQRSQNGIHFIYTGSIGLPNIAKNLNATATINDLNIVEVPPLTSNEAHLLATRLFDHYNVKYSDDAIDTMMTELKWLLPFFVQLIVQMLIDQYESTQTPVTSQTVIEAVQKASNHRNNIYFENYYSRIKKTLPKEESALALNILAQIATAETVPLHTFDDNDRSQQILEILESDGYINPNNGYWSFNSPILRLWWLKYAKV